MRLSKRKKIYVSKYTYLIVATQDAEADESENPFDDDFDTRPLGLAESRL
jgi:hypothetical protein